MGLFNNKKLVKHFMASIVIIVIIHKMSSGALIEYFKHVKDVAEKIGMYCFIRILLHN